MKVRKDEGGWLAIDPPLECSVWISRKYTRVVSNSEKTETVLEPEKTQPSPPPVKKREITLPVPVVKKTNGLPSGVNKPPMPDNDEPFPGTNPDIEATVIRSNSEKNGQEIPWDLKDKKLVASMPQGRMVFYRNSAVLKTGFMWRKPSEYRLVQYDGRDHAVTRCYLTGHDSQLKALEGKRIDIYVREYWVQGVKLPVAVPDLVSKKL